MSAARRPALHALAALCALALCAAFLALGNWQLARRAWKLELIERVEQRAHAAPGALPPPAQWPGASAARDEYRRVRVSGRLLLDRQTRVQATTALGSGYWLLAPLVLADGHIVLLNRGFVAADQGAGARPGGALPAQEPVTVTGLLRMSEPGGTLLRHNEPAADRWYSRDVAAIAAARGLAGVAPFFIDAEAAPAGATQAPDQPVAGLTVLSFPNNHLVYALTWYALALLVALGAAVAVRAYLRGRTDS